MLMSCGLVGALPSLRAQTREDCPFRTSSALLPIVQSSVETQLSLTSSQQLPGAGKSEMLIRLNLSNLSQQAGKKWTGLSSRSCFFLRSSSCFQIADPGQRSREACRFVVLSLIHFSKISRSSNGGALIKRQLGCISNQQHGPNQQRSPVARFAQGAKCGHSSSLQPTLPAKQRHWAVSPPLAHDGDLIMLLQRYHSTSITGRQAA